MAVNLQDGYWLPTGWTAMTQMYGPVHVGDTLHAIDTSGQPLTQPFSTPGNFKVVALIEDASLGAKFAIYKDEATNRVMPVAMGTNGWGDGQGWYANFVNVGLVQWRVPTVKATLFEALNAVVDANTQVVFTGDSKGGALVQFMINDFINDRDHGTFIDGSVYEHPLLNLASLGNDRLGLLAHSAPSAVDVIQRDDASFNPLGSQFNGIPFLYISAKGEKISLLGGPSYVGTDKISEYSQGLNVPALLSITYLHRIIESGFDWLDFTKGLFTGLHEVPKQSIYDGDLVKWGSFFATLGAGEEVNNPEAYARLFSGLLFSLATSPLSAIQDRLDSDQRNSILNLVAGIGVAAYFDTVGQALLTAAGVSLVVDNILGLFTGDSSGLITATYSGLELAVSKTGAPINTVGIAQRVFGETRGLDYSTGISVTDVDVINGVTRTYYYDYSSGKKFSKIDSIVGASELSLNDLRISYFIDGSSAVSFASAPLALSKAIKIDEGHVFRPDLNSGGIWVIDKSSPNADISTTTDKFYNSTLANTAISSTIKSGADTLVLISTLNDNGQFVLHGASINGVNVDVDFMRDKIDKLGIDAISLQQKGSEPAKLASLISDAQLLVRLEDIKNGLNTLTDAFSFFQALQSGKPLPIISSGLKLSASIDLLDHHPTMSLQGAASVAGAINSVMSLNAALENGDATGVAISAAQTIQYSASAYSDIAQSFFGQSATSSSVVNANALASSAGKALPYLQIVDGLVKGDPWEVASGALMATGNPYCIAAAVVINVVHLFVGSAPPRAWGSGQYTWETITNSHTEYDGEGGSYEVIDNQYTTNQIVINAQGESGGDARVNSVLQSFLGAMQNIVDQANANATDGAKVGLIPNRMPRLEWHEAAFNGNAGYAFSDIDPLTGIQRNANIRYDDAGRAYNATPGTPEAYTPFSTAFIQSALIRGAIAPMWEVETARLQSNAGDPDAGLTELERAAKNGHAATVDADGKANGHFRPVTFDLDNDGKITIKTKDNANVSFDWDDSGYLKETGWVGANDGFLVLDRNINNVIDSGQELISSGLVSDAAKGMAGLAWMDANYDGKLDANDPVFQSLRIWQDVNQNGKEDGVITEVDDLTRPLGNNTYEKKLAVTSHPELKTLAELGIVGIDYANNRYIKADGGYGLATTSVLEADHDGVSISIVANGIVIKSSATGEVQLVVTKVEDKSSVFPGEDVVHTDQDMPVVIQTSLLLANDRLGGVNYSVSGANLSIVGVSHAAAGQVTFDSESQLIHFTPNAGFVGSASFQYTLQGPDGSQSNVPVDIVVRDVNDAPIGVDHKPEQLPIYGWATTPQYSQSSGDDPSYYISGYSNNGESVHHPFVRVQYTEYTGDGDNPSTINHDYDMTYDEWLAVNAENPQFADSVHKWIFNTIIDYEVPQHGLIDVQDVDDSANFKFELVGAPLYGDVTLDAATGAYSYLGVRDLPDGSGFGSSNDHFAGDLVRTDVFKVRVWDKNGDVNAGAKYSDIDVSVPHYGYSPLDVPSGGGGKKPIAIDLDRNGIHFKDVDDANVFFDVNGDGIKLRTAWMSAGDGLLARDIDGNGLITSGREIAFQNPEGDALTDLDGLRSLDSNHDGLLSAADSKWNEFGVWKDANSNGVTDAGEFLKLNDMNIYAIELTSDGQFQIVNNQTVHGMGKIQMTDGSTLNFADVTLRYSNQIQTANGDTSGIQPFAPVGSPLLGSADKDLLIGEARNDVLKGLDNDDVIMDDIGDDAAEGGAGNDQIFTGVGNDYVDGGTGNDTVFLGAGNDFALGGDGDDFVYGEAGNDVVFAGAGDDLVAGGDGNDVLTGNDGSDQLVGGTGRDVLFGNAGHDELIAGADDDLLYGGDGADWLDGGDGADEMHGEAGDDTYVVGSAQDTVVEHSNEGKDTIHSTIDYSLGENIEQLILFANAITGTGNTLDNYLEGNAVNNALSGLAGNDTLDGKSGLDTLSGGSGDDTYVVDTSTDIVVELAGEGSDTVQSSVTYALGFALENLTLTGSGAVNGTGNTLNNMLVGNTANNVLNGGAGIDTLAGGEGDDIYVVDITTDVIAEFVNEGIDTVQSSASYTLSDNLEDLTLTGNSAINAIGNFANNTLVGNSASNILDGNAGIDTLVGGLGDDFYVVDTATDIIIEWAGEGTDTVRSSVDYTLGVNLDNLVLAENEAINGVGNEHNNTLTGNNANNSLASLAGDDVLNGMSGIDTLVGGAGDDLYVVDTTTDVITELTDEGTDTVQSSVSYVLGGNLEHLVLTGNSAINGTGNELDNTLIGNSTNNVLDGASGIDTLIGGTGDDVYVVDTLDVITELTDAGIDTVQSSVSYVLGVNLEHLVLTGNSAINGTGNEFDNTLTGNSANNLLDGALGVDTLIGGSGDDIYVVDTSTDVIIELTADGFDTVQSSISYTLGLNLDNLILTGGSAISGTGNSLANALTGNSTDNVLNGLSGIDTLIGGAGNDVYIVDTTTDIITEYSGEGSDTVQSSISYTLGANLDNLLLIGSNAINGTGNELNNVLTGTSANNSLMGLAGNDVLNGQSGIDTLAGGAGDDLYIVDTTTDVITEISGEGVDTVQSSVSYTLGVNLDNLILTDGNVINAIGNELNNLLVGNSANNILDGQSGIDTLVGGAGDDFYAVDAADVITELSGEGIDIVQSSVSYTLASNIENLTLVGNNAINATGNDIGNILIGNSANNVLDGKAGIDTLSAGLGNDTYVIDSTDVITELSGEGIDTVQSSVSYTLGANLDNLTLTGSLAINATGNELDNLLMGNTGNNVLNGGVAVTTIIPGEDENTYITTTDIDTLVGGLGDDTYEVDSTPDVIVELAAEGTDTVLSSVSYILGVNLENLTLANGASNGTGNELNNVLTGNSAANVLNGGLGVDTLKGGAGNDTYVMDTATDVVIELAGEGIDTAQSSVSYTLGTNIDNLILTGSTAINATGNELANVLTGNNANNSLIGLAGNDTLNGMSGIDTLTGGAGNDIYVVDTTTDMITELTWEGIDTVQSSVSYTLGANLDNLALTGSSAINGTGNELSNLLTGNSAINVLDGKAGIDTLVGGAGDDTYYVDMAADVITELSGEGYDWVQSSASYYTLSTNLENLTLSGNEAISGVGNELANGLWGNSANNTLAGMAGSDTLDGQSGIDTLLGGLGNDTYVVDTATDVIVELVDEGIDTVQSSASFTLSTNVDNLTLTGVSALNGTGNELDNILTGNNANNNLAGLAGNDTLDGKSGIDTLTGGIGDDVYLIDSTTDVITELNGEGIDTVQSSVTYTLGANLDNLLLTGAGAIKATGNQLDNVLTGNNANNTLTGAAGNDTLDGKSGIDTLVGGTGDDVYVINTTTDVITELAGEGTDTVQSSVSYTLGANLDNLTLTNSVNGTGNELNNVLVGNNGNNVLNGGLGIDTLQGKDGDDVYVVDTTTDVIIESTGDGIDTVQSSVSYTLGANLEYLTLTGSNAINGTGNELDNVLTGTSASNTLTGAAGNDTLDGGLGADSMVGGTGNDLYYIDVTTDVITELAGEGSDLVQSLVSYTLGANLDNLTLVGSAISGTGNELNNVLTGNSANNILAGGAGNDTLDGGLGADSMAGGIGNDIYYVDATADVVTELAGDGYDLVRSSVSYTLGANLEHLELGGASAINATGNELSNYLSGNGANNSLSGLAGNDSLYGGAGIDTLVGGAGDDLYFIDTLTDVITELTGEGSDWVYSSVSYTLGANLENVLMAGTSAINGTGNALDNVLMGNSASNRLAGAAGNDTLDGGSGAGADTLVGGTGDDIYTVNTITDVITELTGEGIDTVQSSVSYTLGANLENLTLTGGSAIIGTGNELNNVLTGNSANNKLTGGAGNDTYMLASGCGVDTLVENDSTANNVDVLLIASVSQDQLWFKHAGNNLEVSIIGTNDKAVVKDWYSGNANHLEQFKIAINSKVLLDTGVESLVTAMAGMTPPPFGQTTLTASQHAALDGVIGANWL